MNASRVAKLRFAALPLLAALPSRASARTIPHRERIAAQARIERFFYDQRSWPKENPGVKPPYERAVPAEAVEFRVRETAAFGAAARAVGCGDHARDASG